MDILIQNGHLLTVVMNWMYYNELLFFYKMQLENEHFNVNWTFWWTCYG